MEFCKVFYSMGLRCKLFFIRARFIVYAYNGSKTTGDAAEMGQEWVVLVDQEDREIGVQEKWQAHVEGQRHRAFSVFVWNQKGEWLLQRRAQAKYHSPGLWTNTCCSHPRPGEPVLEAARRRLQEEMGLDCSLVKILDFTYRAELDGGLIEHEFDHVFLGQHEGDPHPNPEEVAEWRWASYEVLSQELTTAPELYTAWFKIIFHEVHAAISTCQTNPVWCAK